MFYVVIIFKYVFDFYAEDVFWCIVDIGWIIGYFYVIYGLLVNGVISVLVRRELGFMVVWFI